MSKGQLLRDLVNARLTAAAEEIFVLFNKTIAEYEEELSRSKEENKRLLDSIVVVVSPSAESNTAAPSRCPPGLCTTHNTQESTETPQIKNEPEDEEQLSIKHEEQLLLSEPMVVCVKQEDDYSLPQQRHDEHQGELECEIQIENLENWVSPLTASEGTETVHDGKTRKEEQRRRRNESAPETTCALESDYVMLEAVPSMNICKASEGDESNGLQCPVCKKMYTSKQVLKIHSKLHTGERPFSCSICMKTFTQKSTFEAHQRIHTGERPYSCAVCKKTFNQSAHLLVHNRIHTGERPFTCSVCNKTFIRGQNLRAHENVHKKEKLLQVLNM